MRLSGYAKRELYRRLRVGALLLGGIVACVMISLPVQSLPKASEQASPDKRKPTIIALAPHIVELLFEIGAGAQIIGTTEFADYPEAAKQIPVVGNYLGLNIETIVSLDPDLIIAWRGGNVGRDLEKLQRLGLPIVYSQPLSLPDIARDLREFGKHSHNVALAERKAQQFETALALLQKQYQSETAIKVFYEIWHRPLTTVAKQGWAHNLLSVCQLDNVFADIAHPYPQVNIEQVLARDVQLIIQPQSPEQESSKTQSSNTSSGASQSAAKPATGFHWQAWPDIPAVQQQHILRPNADKLHRMTLRTLVELTDLCAKAHQLRRKIAKKLR